LQPKTGFAIGSGQKKRFGLNHKRQQWITGTYWLSGAVRVKIMIKAIRPVEVYRPRLQGEEDGQDRELLANLRA
jgi:hypothetical protein